MLKESCSLRRVDFHGSLFKTNAGPATEPNRESPRRDSPMGVKIIACQLLASHKGFIWPHSITPGLSLEGRPAWGQEGEDRRQAALLGAKSLAATRSCWCPCMLPEPLLTVWDHPFSPRLSVQWVTVCPLPMTVSCQHSLKPERAYQSLAPHSHSVSWSPFSLKGVESVSAAIDGFLGSDLGVFLLHHCLVF